MQHTAWQIGLKVIAVVFALAPCCLVGFYLAPWLLATIPELFSPRLPIALLQYLLMGAFFFGMYELGRWLLGTSLASCAVGLTSGAVAMAYFVLLPYGLMFAADSGLYEPRFNSGMDNYGIAFAFSNISISPLIVYLALAIAGWRSRLSTAHAAGNIERGS